MTCPADCPVIPSPPVTLPAGCTRGKMGGRAADYASMYKLYGARTLPQRMQRQFKRIHKPPRPPLFHVDTRTTPDHPTLPLHGTPNSVQRARRRKQKYSPGKKATVAADRQAARRQPRSVRRRLSPTR